MIRALPLLLLLSACADFPEVGRAEAKLASRDGTPALLTEEELALAIGNPSVTAPALSAEAAALHARANRLRQR